MFNIFKKFVKKDDEKELLQEQSSDFSADNDSNLLESVSVDKAESTDEKDEKDLFYYIEKKNEELQQEEHAKVELFQFEIPPKIEELEKLEVLEESEEASEDAYIEEAAEENSEITAEISQDVEYKEDSSSRSFFGISIEGLKDAVSKTSEFFSSNIFSLGAGKTEIDDDLLDEMEEKFIRADIGVNTTVYIVERLRENKNKVKPDALHDYLKNEFKGIIKAPGSNTLNLKQGQLNTILITGVNGAGKTTLIGKLAFRFNVEGKKVLVAAGDTFRAAAEDQLEIWAKRAGADIVRQDGADPASVVFDSIKKAKDENYDVLLIDTAGRLHNKFNLMEELRKIKKVIDKEASETLVESILVLDATTGQNGLKQAEVFKEAVDLTCVGLTKLDGTAKGGVILGIAKELNLPVKLIGVGEKMQDLKDFNADDFVDALF